VIIGENRTFDHVFATYQPKRREAVSNLLSKGIVNSDGTPGPNFSLASQSSANDSSTGRLSAGSIRQRRVFRIAAGPCRWI